MIKIQDIDLVSYSNEYRGMIYASDLTHEQQEELGLIDSDESVEITGEFKLNGFNNKFTVELETCVAYNGARFVDLSFPQLSVNHIEDKIEELLIGDARTHKEAL